MYRLAAIFISALIIFQTVAAGVVLVIEILALVLLNAIFSRLFKVVEGQLWKEIFILQQ